MAWTIMQRRLPLYLATLAGLGCAASLQSSYSPVADRAYSDLCSSAYLTSSGRLDFRVLDGSLAPITSASPSPPLTIMVSQRADKNADGIVTEQEVMELSRHVLWFNEEMDYHMQRAVACFQDSEPNLPQGWNDPARWRALRRQLEYLIEHPRPLIHIVWKENVPLEDPFLEERLRRLNNSSAAPSVRTLAQIREYGNAQGYFVTANFSDETRAPRIILVGDRHTSREDEDFHLLSYLAQPGTTTLLEALDSYETERVLLYNLESYDSDQAATKLIVKALLEDGRENVRILGLDNSDNRYSGYYLMAVHASLSLYLHHRHQSLGFSSDPLFNEMLETARTLSRVGFEGYTLNLRDQGFVASLNQSLASPSLQTIVFCGDLHARRGTPLHRFIDDNEFPAVYIRSGLEPDEDSRSYEFSLYRYAIRLSDSGWLNGCTPQHAFVDLETLFREGSPREIRGF